MLLSAACGPAPGAGEEVLSSAVIPEGHAECRRFQTCVPENPCHTGWVTGCRRNVPICTDIGGWLANGTSCAAQAVCYMGECLPCAAGASCPIADPWGTPDPCRAGVVQCGTGQPVCVEAGPAPDGTACAFGVCVAGLCTWCAPGAQCTAAEDPCHYGALTCTTGPVCVPTAAPVPDGWGCGPDLYCQGGACVPCVWGQACTLPEMPCWSGQTTCFAGPQCQPAAPLPDGTACPGGLCGGGTCRPCGPAASCPSPNPCQAAGQISCATFLCEPVGPPVADGTACGPAGETCTAGVCTGVPGAHFLVRTASGTSVDVTGTVWTDCYADEPNPGMSRRATDTFGAGTFTHTDVVFTSRLDCTGPTDPALGLSIDARTLSYGDRVVGWDQGPPPGLAPAVTASAVLLSGVAPGTGLPDPFPTLFFVDDRAAPWMLHMGKGATGPDGFPLTLATSGRPRAGAPVIVRTASGGALDLTGTTWTACFPASPDPWTSRRTTDLYGAGILTHSEEIFPTALDCTGPTDPARSVTLTAAVEVLGDRLVGWTNGTPPVPGLPPAVLATGVGVSAVDPKTGTPIAFRDLRFVDDAYESPRALYQGNGDGPLDLDGFPTQLANEAAREPIPARTVTGTRAVTFWPDTGPTGPLALVPASAVAALLPNAMGGYDVRNGTVAPDGSFSIPGVPPGAYLLRLDASGVVYLAETDAGAVDMGVDALGRPGVAWAQNVPLTTTVTNLEPWTQGDLLEAYSATAPVATMPFGAPDTSVPAGVTAWTGSSTLAATALPGPGDLVRVFQARTAALGPAASYVAASSAGVVDVPTLTAAGPNAWTAALAPVVERGTFRSSWPAPLYEASLADMGPGAVVQNQKIGVTAASRPEPLVPRFPGTYMGTVGPALLVASAGAGFPGMDLDLTFGRFLPYPWTEYRDVRMSARVNLVVGTTTYVARPSVGRMEPLATAPFEAAPLVTPPRDVRLNGLSASAPLAGVGTGPTLTWAAPAIGAPTSYVVRVQALPGFATVVLARTTGTGLRIPDGVLQPGMTYFAWLSARVTPAERLDAPLRNEFGGAFGETVTSTFTP